MNPYFRAQTTEKELKLSQTNFEDEKEKGSETIPGDFQMILTEKAVQTSETAEEKIISRPKRNTNVITHINRLKWTFHLQEPDKLILQKIMGKTRSRVLKIVKCHNQTLYQRYMSNKIDIEQDYPGAVMLERFGFHGTSPEILGKAKKPLLVKLQGARLAAPDHCW